MEYHTRMFPRRDRLKRLSRALLAVLQLGVPPIVGLTDAMLAARAFASAPRVHIEDFGTRDAVPSHPEDCALCQVLRQSSEPPALSPAAVVARTHTAPASSVRHAVEQVAGLRLPDTRAPPPAQ